MVLAKFLSYLIKVERYSCWILFLLMVIFIVTGYSMVGHPIFKRLIDKDTSYSVHLNLGTPLIALFALHMALRIYFLFRRRFKHD